MLEENKFTYVCNSIHKMNEAQLTELAEMAKERIIERRDRFDTLCSGLYGYLEAIFREFPNAKVYLRKGPDELLDLMDFLIPEGHVIM